MLTFSGFFCGQDQNINGIQRLGNDALFISSTTYNVTLNKVIFLDTRSGEFSVSIPLNPEPGDVIVFIDVGGNLKLEKVQINNLVKVFSTPVTNFYLDKRYSIYNFSYVNSDIGWVYNIEYLNIENSDDPLSPDNIETTVQNIINSMVNIPGGVAGLDSNGQIPPSLINTPTLNNLEPVILSAINSQKNIPDGIAGLDSTGKLDSSLINDDENGIVGDAIGSYLMFPKGGTPLESDKYLKITSDTIVNSNQYPLLNQSLNQPDYSFILTDKIEYSDIYAIENQHFGCSCSISNNGLVYTIGAPHTGEAGLGEVHIYKNKYEKSDLCQIIKPKGDYCSFGAYHCLSGDGKTLVVSARNVANTKRFLMIFKNKAVDPNYFIDFYHVQTIENTNLWFSGWEHQRRNAYFTNDDGTLLFVGSPGENKVYIYKYNNINAYTLYKQITLPSVDINPAGTNQNYFGLTIAINGSGTYLAVPDHMNYDSASGTYLGKIYFYVFNSNNETYELRNQIENTYTVPSPDRSYHGFLGLNICMSKDGEKLFSTFTNAINGGSIIVFNIDQSDFTHSAYARFFHPEPNSHIVRTFCCNYDGTYLLCSIYRWWNSETSRLNPRTYLTLLVDNSLVPTNFGNSGVDTSLPGKFTPISDDYNSIFGKVGINNTSYTSFGCIASDSTVVRIINSSHDVKLFNGTNYLKNFCGWSEIVKIGYNDSLIKDRYDIPFVWNSNLSNVYAGSFITEECDSNSNYFAIGNGFTLGTCLLFYEIVNNKLILRTGATPYNYGNGGVISPVLCKTKNIAIAKSGCLYRYLNDIDGWKPTQYLDVEFTETNTQFPYFSKNGTYIASVSLSQSKVILFKFNTSTDKYDKLVNLSTVSGVTDAYFGTWNTSICFSPTEDIVVTGGVNEEKCKFHVFNLSPVVSLVGYFEVTDRNSPNWTDLGYHPEFSYDKKYILSNSKLYEFKNVGGQYSIEFVSNVGASFGVRACKFIDNSYDIIGLTGDSILKLEYDPLSSSKYNLISNIHMYSESNPINFNFANNDNIILLNYNNSSKSNLEYQSNYNIEFYNGGDFKIIYSPPGVEDNDFYVKVA